MKKTLSFFALLLVACTLRAATWTDPASGYTWTYQVLGNDTVRIDSGHYQLAAIAPLPDGPVIIPGIIEGKQVSEIGGDALYYCLNVTSVSIPEGVTSIGSYAFYCCIRLEEVDLPASLITISGSAFQGCKVLKRIALPEHLASIGSKAFYDCNALSCLTIPASVESIGAGAFLGCKGPFFFCGAPPAGVSDASIPKNHTSYPMRYVTEWKDLVGASLFYPDVFSSPAVKTTARMISPTIMEISYEVTSDSPEVKTRAIAFRDGVRSLQNVIKIKTGTNVPNGGPVTSNKRHSFQWDVAKDWATELSKVSVEILVQEGSLLPQDRQTIPATSDHAAMTIIRNPLTTPIAFNALLWCIAEEDPTLELIDGKVLWNGQEIAHGTTLGNWRGFDSLLSYLYGKTGCRILKGEELSYARTSTRLPLPYDVNSLNQLAVVSTEE